MEFEYMYVYICMYVCMYVYLEFNLESWHFSWTMIVCCHLKPKTYYPFMDLWLTSEYQMWILCFGSGLKSNQRMISCQNCTNTYPDKIGIAVCKSLQLENTPDVFSSLPDYIAPLALQNLGGKEHLISPNLISLCSATKIFSSPNSDR